MKLMQVLENLKNDKGMCLYDKVDILYQIAIEHDLYDTINEIVREDDIDYIIKDYSWERIAIFLSGVKFFEKYYYLNGYGNIQNLSASQFDIILEDFIEDIKYNGLENEEVKK